MVHIKTMRAKGLKVAVILIIFLIVSAFFIKDMDFKNILKGLELGNEVNLKGDIYKDIIGKAIPTVDVSMNDGYGEDPGFLAYSILKNITKIDFNNPKTYLQSEIPLLGLFDIDTPGFNAKVTAQLGAESKANSQEEPEDGLQVADLADFFGQEPVDISKIDRDNPAVIIFHTHATESYTPTTKYNYVMMGDHRTTDREYSVCRVGEEIKNYIEKYYGVAVVHDTTFHDYPSYNESYSRSKTTTEALIKKYPNAKLIIDLHRDAFRDDGTAREKTVATINEEQAAKVMFCVGKSNPHWQENYYLSLKINQRIEEIWPGLTRSFYTPNWGLYNQDISNKMVLIEVGSIYNTLEESLATAKVVSKAIGQFIEEDKKE